MRKGYRLITVIIIILISLISGNTKSNGIDNYYFVIAIGIDKGTNDSIKLSIQIPSSSTSSSSESFGSSQSSNYKIYSVEGKTIDECITILNNYLNKQINLSHCSALVISEEIAKSGIKTYFNTFNNNSELRNSCNVLVSSTSAAEFLEKVSGSGEVFSSRLFDYLTSSSDYTAFTVKSTFGTLFQSLNNNYREISTIYTIINDKTVQTAGISVFKNGYMIGHLDINNSICHSIVTNKLKTSVITISNPFDKTTKLDLDINLYKPTKIKIDIINGSPFISVLVYPEGTIRSTGVGFDYTKNQNITIAQNTVNSYLEKNIKEYLYKITKEYNADIVGFKGIYESKFLTESDFDKVHWNEIFSDSFFDVSVNTQINSSHLFNKE